MIASPRYQSVDLWRLIAAFGVILIHLAPNTPAAEALTQAFSIWVVPFFYTISLYFLARKMATRRVEMKDALAWKIVPAYLAWTAIYLIARNAKFFMLNQPFEWNLADSLLLGESSVHLYFIPNLLVFQATGWLINETLLERRFKANSLVALTFIAAFALYKYRQNPPDALWFIVVAAAYFAAARLLLALGATGKSYLSIACASAGLLIALHLTGELEAYRSIIAVLAGFAMSWVALAMPFSTKSALLQWAMGAYLVVYLSHFLFLEMLEFSLDRVYPINSYTIASKLFLGLIILAISLAFLAVARKIPLARLRMCLVGEK